MLTPLMTFKFLTRGNNLLRYPATKLYLESKGYMCTGAETWWLSGRVIKLNKVLSHEHSNYPTASKCKVG